jgi:hypothetical protein
MGILPMSLTGVPPVQMPKNMGKMPMRLMGETPMLRRMAFFNGLLADAHNPDTPKRTWGCHRKTLLQGAAQ